MSTDLTRKSTASSEILGPTTIAKFPPHPAVEEEEAAVHHKLHKDKELPAIGQEAVAGVNEEEGEERQQGPLYLQSN